MAKTRGVGAVSVPAVVAIIITTSVSCGAPGAGSGQPGDPPAAVAFTDITASSGLPDGAGQCLVVRDFDHDGRPDVLLTTVAVRGGALALMMFANAGANHFVEARETPTDLQEVLQCVVADIDRDGFLDLAVMGNKGLDKGLIRIFRNTGVSGMEFEDVTGATARLAGGFIRTIAFFDYDNDGLVDLAVARHPVENTSIVVDHCDVTEDRFQCYFGQSAGGLPVSLLRGNGHAGFEAGPTLGHALNTNVLVPIDWDLDGLVDLFECNEYAANALYHNEGGGQFSDIIDGVPASVANAGMGAAAGDFNRDGRTDLFVTDLGPSHLFLGGDAGLMDAGRRFQVTAPSFKHSSWSPLVADFNLDGFDDLFVASSLSVSKTPELLAVVAPASMDEPQFDLVFSNWSGQTFETTNVPHRGPSRNVAASATAIADFDGDGAPDVLVSFSPLGAPDQHDPMDRPELRLLHNATNLQNRHWLGVRLTRPDHGSRIGARVVLEEGRSAAPRWRSFGADSIGVSEDVVYFGLDDGLSLDSLTVHWPGGRVQNVRGPIAADRVFEVAME